MEELHLQPQFVLRDAQLLGQAWNAVTQLPQAERAVITQPRPLMGERDEEVLHDVHNRLRRVHDLLPAVVQLNVANELPLQQQAVTPVQRRLRGRTAAGDAQRATLALK